MDPWRTERLSYSVASMKREILTVTQSNMGCVSTASCQFFIIQSCTFVSAKSCALVGTQSRAFLSTESFACGCSSRCCTLAPARRRRTDRAPIAQSRQPRSARATTNSRVL
eukprot:6173090-Pleurochrysis_carterae.AAC.2